MAPETLTPAGDARILGIFVDNSGNVVQPHEALTVNGWQARYPQFAIQAITPGTVALQVNVDGKDIGEPQIDSLNEWDRTKPHAGFFYLPTAFRTKGTHQIIVKVGNVTTEVAKASKTKDQGELKDQQVINWLNSYGPFKLTIDQQEEFA